MNNLTEDDVPGAKLKFATIKDNTVADLKRWLTCRNLPMTGKKNDLIDRYNLRNFYMASKTINVTFVSN